MIADGSTGEFMHIRYYGFMEKWPDKKSENFLFPEVNSRNFDHAGHGGIGEAAGYSECWWDTALSLTIDDAAFVQVVWREFYPHFVTWNNSDKVLSHSARNMGNYFMATIEFYPKLGIGKRLRNNPFYFDRFFFWHDHLMD